MEQKQKFRKLALFFLFASVLVPLIVVVGGDYLPSFIFPFVVPRILFFRSTILLSTVFFLLSLDGKGETKFQKFSPIDWTVLFFFFSFFLSTFFGVDWYRSLWDNQERMLGLFTLFHFVLFYFLLRNLIQTRQQWNWFARLFLLVGGVVMVVGIMQKIDPQFFFNRNDPRVFGTLGNPIYFSGFGLFLFALGWINAMLEQGQIFRACSVLGALLGVLGVFLGGTRGTILGLFVGGIVVVVLWILFHRRQPRLARVAGVVLLCTFLLLGGIYLARATPVVNSLPGVSRFFKTDFGSDTSSTRIMAWKIALHSWSDHPVFGWGPGNFFYAFNAYYNPEFLNHGWGETWFDNAHNVVLNTLATQGIVGVMAYLALFFVPIYYLLVLYKKGDINVGFFSILIGFLVAHFVHNLFVFENPTSYLYFFFIFGFMAWLIDSRLSSTVLPVPEPTLRKVSLVKLWSFLMVGLMFVFFGNINSARANIRALALIHDIYAGQWDPVDYESLQKVRSPHQDDIREDIARTLLEVAPEYEKISPDTARDMLFLAYQELEKNRQAHPLDVRTLMTQAQVANVLVSLGYENLLSTQEENLEEAVKLSPKRQQILYMLSSSKLSLGKIEEGRGLLEQAIAENPKIAESWWRLAYFYEILEHPEESARVISEAKQVPGLLFLTKNDEEMFLRWSTTSSIKAFADTDSE